MSKAPSIHTLGCVCVGGGRVCVNGCGCMCMGVGVCGCLCVGVRVDRG